MPSRDYLIRQVEEMGYFLSILLRRILKLKEENPLGQIESVVKESLLQEMTLDIDQIVILEEGDFLNIVNEQLTSDDQLDKLADILNVLGQEIEHSFTLTRVAYLRKSLFLYVLVQNRSLDFSYERKIKIEELQEVLRIHGLLE